MRRTNAGSVKGKTPNGRPTQQSAPENVPKGMECEKKINYRENKQMKNMSETKRSVEKYARQD